MALYENFWPIIPGKDYSPTSNLPSRFGGSISSGSTALNGVDNYYVLAISARIAQGDNIVVEGPGLPGALKVTGTATNSLFLSGTAASAGESPFYNYYDYNRPHSIASPIQAILVQSATGTLTFRPNGVASTGYTSTSLDMTKAATGAIYPYSIGYVTTAVTGAFIGLG